MLPTPLLYRHIRYRHHLFYRRQEPTTHESGVIVVIGIVDYEHSRDCRHRRHWDRVRYVGPVGNERQLASHID
jgi:hypothetical protein